MESLFRIIAGNAALVLELIVILLVVAGAAETLVQMARYWFVGHAPGARRSMWMGYARWLLAALEFALGADIIRTAIAPTWTDIGQLAAIAAVRTGLGFFLEKDMDSFGGKADGGA